MSVRLRLVREQLPPAPSFTWQPFSVHMWCAGRCAGNRPGPVLLEIHVWWETKSTETLAVVVGGVSSQPGQRGDAVAGGTARREMAAAVSHTKLATGKGGGASHPGCAARAHGCGQSRCRCCGIWGLGSPEVLLAKPAHAGAGGGCRPRRLLGGGASWPLSTRMAPGQR